MWSEAFRVAIYGFSVVFTTLFLLGLSVKIMSFFCKRIEKHGGK